MTVTRRIAVPGLLVATLVASPAPARAQVSVGVPAPAGESAPATAQPRAAAPAAATRIIALDFGQKLLGVEFQTAHPVELHDELGDFKTQYDTVRAVAWNANLGWRLGWRPLGMYVGVGVEFSMVDKPMAVTLDARIPHPNIYAFPRELATPLRGLKRQEMGLHFQGQLWRPLTDRLLLRVFAGPTIFLARQDIVTRIHTDDVEPYRDRVSLSGFDRTTATAEKAGYNIGFGLTWFMNDRMGLGGAVRYSRASITALADDLTPVPFALGGPKLGAGVRFRF